MVSARRDSSWLVFNWQGNLPAFRNQSLPADVTIKPNSWIEERLWRGVTQVNWGKRRILPTGLDRICALWFDVESLRAEQLRAGTPAPIGWLKPWRRLGRRLLCVWWVIYGVCSGVKGVGWGRDGSRRCGGGGGPCHPLGIYIRGGHPIKDSMPWLKSERSYIKKKWPIVFRPWSLLKHRI